MQLTTNTTSASLPLAEWMVMRDTVSPAPGPSPASWYSAALLVLTKSLRWAICAAWGGPSRASAVFLLLLLVLQAPWPLSLPLLPSLLTPLLLLPPLPLPLLPPLLLVSPLPPLLLLQAPWPLLLPPLLLPPLLLLQACWLLLPLQVPWPLLLPLAPSKG